MKALVHAIEIDEATKDYATTDAAGRFRMVVPAGEYNIMVDAKDRVCVAIADQKCSDGQQIELPQLKLIRGGFITGHVLNSRTGQAVMISDNGLNELITLGFYGPSQPPGRHSQQSEQIAVVNDDGKFTMRAVPGKVYPFLYDTHGDRMPSTTLTQPPVIVKDGETTTYDMFITPQPPTQHVVGAGKIIEQLAVADLPKKETAPAQQASGAIATTGPFTLHGKCIDDEDEDEIGLPGVRVRLFKIEGMTEPPVEIAQATTDQSGRFDFIGLPSPRPGVRRDRLEYDVFAQDGKHATAWGRSGPLWREKRQSSLIRMQRKRGPLTGTVLDPQGNPLAGAAVMSFRSWLRQPFACVGSTTTDRDGRFRLDDLRAWIGSSVTVAYPGLPVTTTAEVKDSVGNVTVRMSQGGEISGTVIDEVTDEPAPGTLVLADTTNRSDEAFAVADAKGHFRITARPGRFNITLDAKNRVCVAIRGQELLAGEKVELPPIRLITGGLIVGQIVNSKTGEPESLAHSAEEPISVGLYGPSQPPADRHIMYSLTLATVDDNGKFVMRAAPGENFPYFTNSIGDRMPENALQQPPVIVRAGETTKCILHTPFNFTAGDKTRAAKWIVPEGSGDAPK